MDSLSEDVLAYFRVTLSQKFEPEKRAHLLVSTPVDVEFEMLVLACSINLLNDFFSKRFKSTLEEDLELIKNPQLAYNVRLAIMNRIDLKQILNSNVKIFNVLIHILGRIQAEIYKIADQAPQDQKEGKFTKDFIRALYVQRVDQYEADHEVMKNRLILRKYLREILTNQTHLSKSSVLKDM